MRRCLELRRAICKRPRTMAKAQNIVASYLKCREDAHKWYEDKDGEGSRDAHTYCKPIQHPSSGTNDTWKKQVCAKGPIGLLIQSVLRTGAKITKDFIICKPKEQDINIPKVPFQYIKDLVGGAGRRARTEADRSLKYSKTALKEIDYDITKRSTKLSKEDEGFLLTIQMGGGLGTQDLAALDADLEDTRS